MTPNLSFSPFLDVAAPYPRHRNGSRHCLLLDLLVYQPDTLWIELLVIPSIRSDKHICMQAPAGSHAFLSLLQARSSRWLSRLSSFCFSLIWQSRNWQGCHWHSWIRTCFWERVQRGTPVADLWEGEGINNRQTRSIGRLSIQCLQLWLGGLDCSSCERRRKYSASWKRNFTEETFVKRTTICCMKREWNTILPSLKERLPIGVPVSVFLSFNRDKLIKRDTDELVWLSVMLHELVSARDISSLLKSKNIHSLMIAFSILISL